jgi:hypothetical protein
LAATFLPATLPRTVCHGRVQAAATFFLSPFGFFESDDGRFVAARQRWLSLDALPGYRPCQAAAQSPVLP